MVNNAKLALGEKLPKGKVEELESSIAKGKIHSPMCLRRHTEPFV
jgi:hypothetical protein